MAPIDDDGWRLPCACCSQCVEPFSASVGVVNVRECVRVSVCECMSACLRASALERVRARFAHVMSQYPHARVCLFGLSSQSP
eukprot:9831532-Alexandrium_andersonii.AAC.1